MSMLPLLAGLPTWLVPVVVLVILLGALVMLRGIGNGRPHS